MRNIITKVLAILLLILLQIKVNSQTNSTYKYFGAGILNNSFQETKFSNMQYRGFGINITPFGWQKQTNKNIFNVDTKIGIAFLSSATNNVSKNANPEMKISFLYLRAIKNTNIMTYNVGIGINTDFSMQVQELYYFFGNTITANIGAERQINNNNKISLTIGIGIIGLVKELRSFAFIAPQKYIEEGSFDYADKNKIINPLGYNTFAFIGKYNRIKSNLQWHHKKWIFSYEWNLINYTSLKKYPSNTASHNFMICKILNSKNKDK